MSKTSVALQLLSISISRKSQQVYDMKLIKDLIWENCAASQVFKIIACDLLICWFAKTDKYHTGTYLLILIDWVIPIHGIIMDQDARPGRLTIFDFCG